MRKSTIATLLVSIVFLLAIASTAYALMSATGAFYRGSYQLGVPTGKFYHTGGNGTNGTNTSGRRGILEPYGKPDLIIQSYSVANNGSNSSNTTAVVVTISAVVKNVGTTNAGTSYTKFIVFGGPSGNTVPTPALKKGASTTVKRSFLLNGNQQYPYQGTITADTYNQVKESKENNNVQQIIFSV